jgi:hypothetical protein
MKNAEQHLPKTDKDCDERLVKVAALYVIERGMPVYAAINILEDGIKQRQYINDRINELIIYIANGASPI